MNFFRSTFKNIFSFLQLLQNVVNRKIRPNLNVLLYISKVEISFRSYSHAKQRDSDVNILEPRYSFGHIFLL